MVSSAVYGRGDIDIDVTGTSERIPSRRPGSIESNGIYARHAGSGNIDIDVTGTSGTNTIATTGASGEGISAYHVNMGHIDIDIKNGMLTTSDYSAIGVYATHSGTGNIDIDLAEGTTINTKGLSSPGVNAKLEGRPTSHQSHDVNIITKVGYDPWHL